MIYHGHIENGLVVLDESVALPEGAQVIVHIQEQTQPIAPAAGDRTYFGLISSGDARSADNDRIDADLARTYGANS